MQKGGCYMTGTNAEGGCCMRGTMQEGVVLYEGYYAGRGGVI